MLNKFNQKPVFWYTSGAIISQISAFLMLPIYTQYLTPEEYGVIGLLVLVLSVYELFLGARFGVALPKFYYDGKDLKEKNHTIATALVFTVGVSVLGSILFALSSPLLVSSVFERPDLHQVIQIYAITLVTASMEAYGLVYLRLRDKPHYFFALSMLKMLLQISLNLTFLIVFELGLEGVIYSSIISSVILASICAIYIAKNAGITFEKEIAKRLWVFTWPLWLSGMGTLYITFSTNFLIKYFASLTDVGLYQFALKFSTLIAILFWTPFNQWWQVQRFKIANEANEPKEQFYAAFFLVSAVLSLAVLGISLFSDIVMQLIVGEEFHRAIQYIPILCVIMMGSKVLLLVQFPLLKTGNTKVYPKITFFNAIGVTICVSVGTIHYGLKGAVYGILLCQVVEFCFTYLIGKSKYDLGVSVHQFFMTVAIAFLLSQIGLSTAEGRLVHERFIIYTLVVLSYMSLLSMYIWINKPLRHRLTTFVRLYII